MDARDRGAGGGPETAGTGDLYYLGLSLAALVVLVLTLSELRLLGSAYIPYVVFGLGVLGLAFRLPSAPPLILVVLGVLLLTRSGRPAARVAGGPALDLMLCASALTFVIAFYRRLSVESGIFPADPRKAPPATPGGKPVPVPRVRRAASLAAPGELAVLGFVIPLGTVTGYVLLRVLYQSRPPRVLRMGDHPEQWRLLVVCWAAAAAFLAGAVVLAYLGRARATRAQNLMFLQDQLWSETPREQGRVNRLLTRARLRTAKGRENP
jgi:hypothetical protein